MSSLYRNSKLFIQFFFFKIIIVWSKAVQYSICCLWQWAARKHDQILEKSSKLLVESEREQEVDSFVKSMQRQAKITGARPKKDI